MSEAPAEEVATPGGRISDAVVGFTGCIGEGLSDICSYGWTIGDTYVPFDPDPDDDTCDEDEVVCSQAWVRVMSISPEGTDSWTGDCGTVMVLTLEVGVLRCVEIPEDGEAPTATSVMAAAMQSMDDMNAIYCAAMECEVWNSIDSGQWTPMGPQGGQYGGFWTFQVEI